MTFMLIHSFSFIIFFKWNKNFVPKKLCDESLKIILLSSGTFLEGKQNRFRLDLFRRKTKSFSSSSCGSKEIRFFESDKEVL